MTRIRRILTSTMLLAGGSVAVFLTSLVADQLSPEGTTVHHAHAEVINGNTDSSGGMGCCGSSCNDSSCGTCGASGCAGSPDPGADTGGEGGEGGGE